MNNTRPGGQRLAIAQLLDEPRSRLKLARFTRTGIVIPRDWDTILWDSRSSSVIDFDADSWGCTEQRTLRGRIVGLPSVAWKHYRNRATNFAPWPNYGAKRYLVVRLATRRHGVVTLPLPPTATDDLLRLEAALAERGVAIADCELRVSVVDRGRYFHATFAVAQS